MNNEEQLPVPKKETPEERSARIAREARIIFSEESNRGAEDAKTSRKPDLDYYDNRREQREDGSDVHYQGRYGKFRNG